MRFYLISFLLWIAFLFISPNFIYACSCSDKPTVLEEFELNEDVIIAEIVDVVEFTEKESYFNNGGAKMSIKKVFKGNLKENEEIFVNNSRLCGWTFDKSSIGSKILMYSTPYEGRRGISLCGRSGGLEYAKEDLLYLENLARVKGKTRISGTISYPFFSKQKDVEGKTVRVIGKHKTYSLKTDKNGIYEIYGLPAGDYFIKIIPPNGWKIKVDQARDSSKFSEYGGYSPIKFKSNAPIQLGKGKHAYVNFDFVIVNSIQGKVLSPQGKPIEGICVTALEAESTEIKYGSFDCTDEKGIFKIKEIYDEKNILVINGDGKIRATQPIEMLFYPNVKEFSKATIIKISEGKNIIIPPFRIPKVLEVLETVTLKGTLNYSDGKPVETETVEFVADVEDKKFEGKPYQYTKKGGTFEIKIFKGQTGKIRGHKIFNERDIESCPDLKNAVIENSPSTSDVFTVATKWMEIKADKDLNNIKLIFPFKECNKP
ncbi:MAG TPA: hypothetical protein PKY82_16735 [Pyrinomonadaceae bacterium]|nr:hypothetical protein [Pyrinomonadaceae bacterium]